MSMAAAIHATLAARLGKTVDKVVVYGDSGTGGLVPALESLLPGVQIINRGVGGYSIEQIADAYEGEGLWTGYKLVVFDLSNDSLANNQANYSRIADAFSRSDGQFIFVQPCITGDAGTGVTGYYLGTELRTTVDAARAWIGTAYPDAWVEVQDALWDANDGSAGDLEDVANGITPRSLREPGDGLHLNAAGSGVVAAQVVAKMTADGWL